MICLAVFVTPVPPVVVWAAGGSRSWTGVVVALFVAAQIVFWGFYALPGISLWGLSVVLSMVPAVLAARNHVLAVRNAGWFPG